MATAPQKVRLSFRWARGAHLQHAYNVVVKRRIGMLVSLVSLLFLVVLLIAWPVSHYVAVALTHQPTRVSVARGSLAIECSQVWVPPEEEAIDLRVLDGPFDDFLLVYDLLGERQFSFAGINFFQTADLTSGFISSPQSSQRAISQGWALEFPLAYLAALSSILPLLWLVFYRKASKRYRKANGLCQQCGYDLRESVAGCPECGLSVAK